MPNHPQRIVSFPARLLFCLKQNAHPLKDWDLCMVFLLLFLSGNPWLNIDSSSWKQNFLKQIVKLDNKLQMILDGHYCLI